MNLEIRAGLNLKNRERVFEKLYSHLLDQDSENYKNMTVKEGIENSHLNILTKYMLYNYLIHKVEDPELEKNLNQ